MSETKTRWVLDRIKQIQNEKAQAILRRASDHMNDMSIGDLAEYIIELEKRAGR